MMGDNIVVKEESRSVDDNHNELEERILYVCQQNENGISDSQLQSVLPDVDVKSRVTMLNKLLQKGKIALLSSGKNLLYKIKTNEGVTVTPGADNQEKIVYQVIAEANNKGIWMRDIRNKTNLVPTQLNKVLKSLEGKKLIKAVRSVNAAKKKVYMLYDLEPDRSLTGGAWYSDQDFESEFVDVLNQQCLKFLTDKLENAVQKQSDPVTIRNASYASAEEICSFIAALGISKIKLAVEDIETILNTLIYDGKAERTVSGADQKSLYRAVGSPIHSTPLARLPCGVCPVVDQCAEGATISPTSCVYLADWLQY